MDIYYLIETAMILVVVMVLCGSLIVKFLGVLKITQDFNYTPNVTVLMSCFNEGQAVYQTIKSIYLSNYPLDKLFVVAIDDCSKDDSWKWMQKAASEHTGIQIYKNETNKGKPKSLLKALAKTTDGLILNIDSDGELHPEAIREMSACFSDPTVGGVGGNVLVRNIRKNWLTQLQAVQYNTAFQISKIGESFSGSVNCISGAIFMVRKTIYDKIAITISNRRRGGLEVKDGEDRYMTNLIMMLGYKTIVTNRAKVYTDVPESFSHFFPQQVRWRRGVLRLFFWTLRPKIFYSILMNSSPLSLVKFYGVVLIVFLWPIFIFWILTTTGVEGLIVHKISLAVLTICASGIAFFSAKQNNDDINVGPLPFVIMPFWMLIDMFFVTVIAVCTFNSISWETRNK